MVGAYSTVVLLPQLGTIITDYIAYLNIYFSGCFTVENSNTSVSYLLKSSLRNEPTSKEELKASKMESEFSFWCTI
ncbi:hypothetical protein L1987_06416 [Smallanthus sonchifolius]|uniref:Uncharacterized protein n=1 Tax=Smallanthus sonchifolius TaxID=185202 RepID=A0ACB9JY99_9ASTR|nr:hypothetical protein L1987_06416 [Smallanthus sonchifolius]